MRIPKLPERKECGWRCGGAVPTPCLGFVLPGWPCPHSPPFPITLLSHPAPRGSHGNSARSFGGKASMTAWMEKMRRHLTGQYFPAHKTILSLFHPTTSLLCYHRAQDLPEPWGGDGVTCEQKLSKWWVMPDKKEGWIPTLAPVEKEALLPLPGSWACCSHSKPGSPTSQSKSKYHSLIKTLIPSNHWHQTRLFVILPWLWPFCLQLRLKGNYCKNPPDLPAAARWDMLQF